MLQKVIYWNFVFATWLFIVFLMFKCYQHFFILTYEHFEIHYFRSLGAYFWPTIFLGAQMTIWYLFYRKNDAAGKIFAFFIGVAIFAKTIIVPLLISDAYGGQLSSNYAYGDYKLGGLYLALSHLAYSLFYRIENTSIRFI